MKGFRVFIAQHSTINDCREVKFGEDYRGDFEYINKQHAIKIINHLTDVFGINSSDCKNL